MVEHMVRRRKKKPKEREPLYGYRSTAERHEAAAWAARQNDESVSQVIRRALDRYVQATERRTGRTWRDDQDDVS